MIDNNFFCIQGWMINRLHLSGNELICYAIIYSFSQYEEGLYKVNINYLRKWMNVSTQTAYNVLKSLVKKGYLSKEERIVNYKRVCYYKAIV